MWEMCILTRKPACACEWSIVYCSIVPPERLYLPVLPFRCNKELMFCLCRSFVITSSIGECGHSTDDWYVGFRWGEIGRG